MRITAQTGRGEGEGNSDEIADYFYQCCRDYREQLGLDEAEFRAYLSDKTILEYGPGDILGVALLLRAYGAKTIHCVDRFPLNKISEKNMLVYQALINRLAGDEKQRAMSVFNVPGDPESGFNRDIIEYSVTNSGLSGETDIYDLIISRAVLEHVNDLEATFLDIKNALKAAGTSIHKVDLKSHGLDRYRPFDFLTWSNASYRLMYSHKGFPNRWRVNKYVQAAQNARLSIKNLAANETLSHEKIDTIAPYLAEDFRNISKEELSWLSFWMVLEHVD
ncbi:methyltransferase domain-containing protein [Methylomonas albis]|uniref:methyltransferase domain-containing protein n=1 Tax=Methylomonas albis TaxID=1854563 RepID=UPI001CAA83A4|nr:methyltransferase domain-containing protein [Methylomonas albis]